MENFIFSSYYRECKNTDYTTDKCLQIIESLNSNKHDDNIIEKMSIELYYTDFKTDNLFEKIDQVLHDKVFYHFTMCAWSTYGIMGEISESSDKSSESSDKSSDKPPYKSLIPVLHVRYVYMSYHDRFRCEDLRGRFTGKLSYMGLPYKTDNIIYKLQPTNCNEYLIENV